MSKKNSMSKKIKNMWHSATKSGTGMPLSLKGWAHKLNDDDVKSWLDSKLDLNRSKVPASTRASIRAERAGRRRSKSSGTSKIKTKKVSSQSFEE